MLEEVVGVWWREAGREDGCWKMSSGDGALFSSSGTWDSSGGGSASFGRAGSEEREEAFVDIH